MFCFLSIFLIIFFLLNKFALFSFLWFLFGKKNWRSELMQKHLQQLLLVFSFFLWHSTLFFNVIMMMKIIIINVCNTFAIMLFVMYTTRSTRPNNQHLKSPTTYKPIPNDPTITMTDRHSFIYTTKIYKIGNDIQWLAIVLVK